MIYTTTKELAERLGISPQAVNRRLTRGIPQVQLPPWSYTSGGRRYWIEADVAKWIQDAGIIKTRRPAGRPKGK